MNLQTILSHPEKKKILENLLAEKIIGEIKSFSWSISPGRKRNFLWRKKGCRKWL